MPARMRRRESLRLSPRSHRSKIRRAAPAEQTDAKEMRGDKEPKLSRPEENTMEPARRIVMFNWMTANGYFSGADGNLDWVVPDEEQAKAAMAGIPLFDTMLFGRRTYESLRNSGAAPTTALPLRRTRTVAENERRNTSPSPNG